MKKLVLVTAITAAFLIPGLASAESNLVTTGNATARLDFRIVIPAVLSLRVGSPGSANANIDLVSFSPAAAIVGDSTPVGGDLGSGVVTVRVIANNGAVNLISTTSGPLTTGVVGETIPWSEIGVTATGGAPTHPTFAAAGASATVAISATNRVVNVGGTWTYRYLNTTTPAAGTYGATTAGGAASVNNGRVIYTASQV